MIVTVDYYLTVVSPFAYFGHDVFLEMMARTGARFRYRPVKLATVFAATGGAPLPKRHKARQHYRLLELQRWREKRGVQLNLMPAYFPADPTLADRSAIAIQNAGGDPGNFVGRAMRAVWAHDKNIADDHVVAGLLADAGQDATAILAEAAGEATAAAYDDNTEEAITLGVVGAPGFVLNGEPFWGQDRIDLLEDAITSGRAPFAATA